MALLGDAQLVVARPGPDPVEHGEGRGAALGPVLAQGPQSGLVGGVEVDDDRVDLATVDATAVVDQFTKSWIALVCSLYSTSPANPRWTPAREVRHGEDDADAGAVTPRVLVLASDTGTPAAPAAPGDRMTGRATRKAVTTSAEAGHRCRPLRRAKRALARAVVST